MTLADWKDILSATATISTIINFLTGLQICRGFVRKGTTGDASGLPFVAGAMNCAVWLKYGILIQDTAMTLVNMTGTVLLSGYTICYYLHAPKKLVIQKQMTFAVGFFFTLLYYLNQMSDEMEHSRYVLGLVGSSLAVGFFASPLASLSHVLKTRSTEVLPFPLIVSSFLVSGQWWLYGIILDDNFVKVPNLLGWCLASFQLLLFVWFPSASTKILPEYHDKEPLLSS